MKSPLFFALGWLMLLSGSPAWGLEGEALEQRVREISDGLRCPTCQAVSVNDSEAAFSRQIKDKVRRMVREGQPEQAIRAFFVSRYGEWILRAPKKEGLGLVLWLLPGAALLGVGGWIGFHVYRNSQAARAGTERERAAPPLSEAERERIRRDVERFEEGG